MDDPALLSHAVAQLHRMASGMPAPCKVCEGETALFDVLDFAKTCDARLHPADLAAVPVYYRRCRACGFIFTDFFDDFSPRQWSAHLYNDDYYRRVDPAYAEQRPASNARGVDHLLRHVKQQVIGLDYGGGSGRTCERLRALGYRFDTFDPFGQRSLTPEFAGRYNFCSAFEVAEHTPDPRGLIDAIVGLASPQRLAILIGTQLHDRVVTDATRLSWWYAAPRNGHISLYSHRAMQILARRHALDYTRLSERTHLFTRHWTAREAWWFLARGKMVGRIERLARRAPAQAGAAAPA
jgi:2-polyprenyl-6-hydroxyphenyl methylase/3-demethylubiquinone-9 3-methyltransferase